MQSLFPRRSSALPIDGRKRGWRRRGALAAGAASLAAVAVGAYPAVTVAAPQAPTVVYLEDFQNRPGPTPIVRLDQYTGAGGQTYTADPQWLDNCNGWIASRSQPTDAAAQSTDCEVAGMPVPGGQHWWNSVQQLSYALGVHSGAADPNNNFAVSAYTAADPGAGHVEFQTGSNIPFSGTNRFITFSVDVAAQSCGFVNAQPPLLQFSLLDSSGNATPVGSEINGCSSTNTVPVPATGVAPETTARVGTYTSNGATLFSGSSIGVRLVNNQASGDGNDHAFDNIRILDVTPSTSKAFSPSTINSEQTSKLTFTIENTTELAAKNGFSFTDALPAGVTIAPAPNASTTCGNGTVTAAAGGSSVALNGGDLAQGAASCTVTVDVTASTPGTYTNEPADFAPVGLNKPGPAQLIVSSDVDLAVVKTGPATVQVGQAFTYQIVVTNNGPGVSSGWTVTDTLPAGMINPSTSTPGCTITGSQLSCTGGALASGASSTITVTGTAPAADTTLNNTATVSGNDPDPNPGNNTSTVTTLAVPLIDPAIGTAVAATMAGVAGTVLIRRRRSTTGTLWH